MLTAATFARTHRAYLTLSAVIFCGYVGVGSTSPFQTLYATSLGASLNQVALVTGVFSTLAMAAGLLWGRLADRLRRRKPFVVGGVAALALIHLATAYVPTWQLLVPLRALEGAASGAYQVASMALMGHLLHGQPARGRMVSGYRMSGSLAFSVAIVFSGWLAQTVGFRGSYLFASGVYVVALLIALNVLEHTGNRGSPEITRARAAPPRDQTNTAVDSVSHAASGSHAPGFVAIMRGPLGPLLVLAVAFGLPFAAVYSVWPIWVANVLGHGRAVYSQLWGLAAFVEVPCMLLAGYLADRVGRRRTFSLGLTFFALVYLAYFLAPPLPGLIAAQVLRGFAFAFFTATALTMAIELAPPEARGRAAGLYSSANGLAQISGNWIGAPLAAAIGFRSFYAAAAVAVLCAALYAQVALRAGPSRGEA